MTFSLSNAPANFKGFINKILAKKLDIFLFFYLDDMLIYTENTGQAHVNAIWWFFEKFKRYGFFANLKKCRFHKDKI